MKKSNVFACWTAAACMSLVCLALSGCTTTQVQADADDVVAAGVLPTAPTCTKSNATSCRAGQTQCTRSGAAQSCKGGRLAKDSAGCCKNKKADSDT